MTRQVERENPPDDRVRQSRSELVVPDDPTWHASAPRGPSTYRVCGASTLVILTHRRLNRRSRKLSLLPPAGESRRLPGFGSSKHSRPPLCP